MTLKSTERAPNGQIWNKFSKKINNVVLGYNLAYEMNTHESILTLKNTQTNRGEETDLPYTKIQNTKKNGKKTLSLNKSTELLLDAKISGRKV